MQTFLIKLGNIIKDRFDDVECVEILDERIGNMCYIVFKDGRRVLLCLIDDEL